jgi:hypothetical protein
MAWFKWFRRTKGEGIVSEATGSGGSRAEMKRRLIERSLEDDAFRQRLLEDPKAAIEQELGTPLPAEVQIRAVEETPDTIYLVLPPATSPTGRGGEISDQELESVAGGGQSIGGDLSPCIVACRYEDEIG